MENNEKQFNLEIRPEIAGGEYSNLAIITHSHSEFILDFAKMLPGLPKPQVSNRIIMTPEHAKNLLFALRDNLTKYEEVYGEIQRTVPRNSNNGNNGFQA